MNHLLLDITETTLPIARNFTDTNWDGIIRDISLCIMRSHTTAHNPIEQIKDIQWCHGFERTNESVTVLLYELYKSLGWVIEDYVKQTNPTQLLTVIRVSSDNNIFQLHLGYA